MSTVNLTKSDYDVMMLLKERLSAIADKELDFDETIQICAKLFSDEIKNSGCNKEAIETLLSEGKQIVDNF